MHSILSYTDEGEKQVQGTVSKFDISVNHPESAAPELEKNGKHKINNPASDSCIADPYRCNKLDVSKPSLDF